MNWRRETPKQSEPTTVCERVGHHVQVNEVTATVESRDFTCSACGQFYSTDEAGNVAREWRVTNP